MATPSRLSRTPYFAFGRRPYREERLLSYIRREHRRGRHVAEILADPYVRRCGPRSLVWETLRETNLISLLDRDVCEAIADCAQELRNHA